jgi:hypothetical protein
MTRDSLYCLLGVTREMLEEVLCSGQLLSAYIRLIIIVEQLVLPAVFSVQPFVCERRVVRLGVVFELFIWIQMSTELYICLFPLRNGLR